MRTTYLSFLLIFLFIVTLQADTIQIGDTEINLTPPGGCMAVTTDMSGLNDYVVSQSGTRNDLLAMYVPESYLEIAFGEKQYIPERSFKVEISQKAKTILYTTDKFISIKGDLVANQRDNFKQLLSAVGIDTAATDVINNKSYVDKLKAVTQVIPFNAHIDNDYFTSNVTLIQDKDQSWIAAFTTIINVSGRLMFLICYVPEEDLEWGKTTCEQWATTLLDINK